MTRRYVLALTATLLAACSRDLSQCPNPERPIVLGGRCYGTAEIGANIGWVVGAVVTVWIVALLVSIRRDVRRNAEALERLSKDD